MKIGGFKNVVIVNGMVLGMSKCLAKTQKIDDTKCVGAEKVSNLRVDSDLASITITTGEKEEVQVHYYGEVCTSDIPRLDVTASCGEVNITAKIEDSVTSCNLKLDVVIPRKMFKFIFVKSCNGRVELGEEVKTESMKITSENGSIYSKASFKEIITKSMNGSTHISVSAKSNIDISASSMNGSITVELANIGSCNISASSMNGSVKNMYNATGEYKATGDISSMNGSIKIKQIDF